MRSSIFFECTVSQFHFKAHQITCCLAQLGAFGVDIGTISLELWVRLTSHNSLLNQTYIQRNINKLDKFTWSKCWIPKIDWIHNKLITCCEGRNICKIFATNFETVFLFSITAEQDASVISKISILEAPIKQMKDEDFMELCTVWVRPCFYSRKERWTPVLSVHTAAVKMGSAGWWNR